MNKAIVKIKVNSVTFMNYRCQAILSIKTNYLQELD